MIILTDRVRSVGYVTAPKLHNAENTIAEKSNGQKMQMSSDDHAACRAVAMAGSCSEL